MEEYYEEEESDGFILSFEDGKGTKLTSKKDYEANIERQQELIREFMNENGEAFSQFLKKKGISEEEFNGETECNAKTKEDEDEN